MNAREPTWFVRLQGHTLGPLSTDELRKSVREGEISPEDKLNRTGELTWRRLADYPDLYAYWESIRRPTFAPNLPSPQLLWKKSRGPLPAPAPVEIKPDSTATLSAKPEIPAAIPAAPTEIPTVTEVHAAPIAKPKKTPKKAAPKKKAVKKAKAAPVIVQETAPTEAEAAAEAVILEAVAAAKSKSKPVSSLSTETATEKPIEIELPVMESEPVAQAKPIAVDSLVQLLDPAALKISPESFFPSRPEVPNVEPIVRPAHRSSQRTATRWLADVQPQAEDRRRKILRIAALVALVLVVAGVAYWAGQKTRDLKELPLSDPSSPTTQLPAASDPIQPLRAPTRPQRD